MTIKVKQAHIDKGRIGTCNMCPVSIAILEQVPFCTDANVHGDKIYVFKNRLVNEYVTPSIVKEFINRFDSNQKCEPFEFEME